MHFARALTNGAPGAKSMTEKHYAHLAPSYVADTIRAHFPTLGIAGEVSVVPMQRKSA
jgi:hypothetical protein